jgi:5'-3' exonuclease
MLDGLREKLLVFDISNVLYRTFFANRNLDDLTTAGLAHHQALTTLNKYYNEHKPDKVIMTFDRANWRVDYSTSDECLSGKKYKGQRRQDMTPGEKERYELFKAHLSDFENLMREHTSIPCMAADGLEADDIMAGVAQIFHATHDVVMISADKDLMQLLRFPTVSLIDPASNKPRTLEEYENDADLFMYIKCFRGDAGDNVQSALPRVRKTKIIEAYNDPYIHTELMERTWTNADGVEMKVKELFEENKLLMDLAAQPEEIRSLIEDVIIDGFEAPGKYSHFHFIKFCGRYELKKIAEHVDRYTPLLSQK